MQHGRGPPIACAIAVALILFCPTPCAADPGADCCTDLEERVAELEATTARKGNRNVSLEVSGVINQALLGWYDGKAKNAFVVTNDNSRTRVGVTGSAKIDRDLQAGFRLNVGIRAANSKIVNQRGDIDRRDALLDIREAVWFLNSKRAGTVFIGATFPSFTNVADANVTQTDWFTKYSGVENTGLSMFLRSARTGELARTLTWRRIIGAGGDQPGETQRGFDLVKYVSPTWHGFTAAASLVADDFWDATLRYRGEVSGFEVAAAGGYLELLPGSRSRGVCALNIFFTDGDTTKCRQAGGSLSVRHQETGLFVNFGGGLTIEGLLQDTPIFAGTNVNDGDVFWAGQAGIERQFNALGKTTLYGEFFGYGGGAPTGIPVGPDDPLNPAGSGFWNVWQSDVRILGGGVAQGIDAAAMVLYLSYRHVEGDVTLRQLQGLAATGPLAPAPIDDLDLVLAGAVVRF